MAVLCRPWFLRATNGKHICEHWASNLVTPVGIERLRVYGIRANLGSAVPWGRISPGLINIDSAIYIRHKLFREFEVDADIPVDVAVSGVTCSCDEFEVCSYFCFCYLFYGGLGKA